MFDENHSGEITLGEFKNKLDALNMGFTTDEIGAILDPLGNAGTECSLSNTLGTFQGECNLGQALLGS